MFISQPKTSKTTYKLHIRPYSYFSKEQNWIPFFPWKCNCNLFMKAQPKTTNITTLVKKKKPNNFGQKHFHQKLDFCFLHFSKSILTRDWKQITRNRLLRTCFCFCFCFLSLFSFFASIAVSSFFVFFVCIPSFLPFLFLLSLFSFFVFFLCLRFCFFFPHQFCFSFLLMFTIFIDRVPSFS